jgi:hypothetical protein
VSLGLFYDVKHVLTATVIMPSTSSGVDLCLTVFQSEEGHISIYYTAR